MKRKIAISLLILSVVLILVGIFNEQFQVVLEKASKVCLECIGIG